jgi:hypothetical protein
MIDATIANFMAHMIEHPRPRVKTIPDIFHAKTPSKKIGGAPASALGESRFLVFTGWWRR